MIVKCDMYISIVINTENIHIKYALNYTGTLWFQTCTERMKGEGGNKY